MSLVDTTWYGNSVGYSAVMPWAAGATIAAGTLRRQLAAPAVGSERVFVCIVAGTTHATTEPTWVLTRGAKTTDNTVTWQECTGASAVNGDLTNTATWAQVKAATPAVLGQIIKRSNNASYQICTTAGAMSASEPVFSDTAGVTTTDTTAVWTSLGAVGNFTGGLAPHARLANVFGVNWFASGNTVYVGDNHAETQAANMTMSPSSALMAKILCHNHSGSYPPAASDITTGATITTTGGTGINFTAQGSFYIYGLVFAGGTAANNLGGGAVGQVQNWYYFDSCSWQSASTSGMFVGASGTAWGVIIFNNTTVKFAAATSFILPYFVQLTWQNTGQILAAGSSVPTNLFNLNNASGRFNTITLNNLDLSQLTGSLFTNASNSSIGALIVQDCKLNAAMTVTTPTNTGMIVQLIRSDSAATSYKSTRYAYEGTETTETSIVRTGGAVDLAGQAQSRKIVTTANAQWLRPFKAEPYAIWNATTGANVTVTVYGTINADALPNNDDIWMEVEYLGSATDPQGKVVSTTKASVLASNAAVNSDTSTWNGIAATTWDLATATALSGGNLIATNTGTTSADQGARALATRTAGKCYYEVTITTKATGANLGFGIGTPASTYTSMGTNSTTGAVLYASGSIYTNGATSGSALSSRSTGDVIGIAVDLDNRQIWFKKVNGTPTNWNGSGAADPATNVGGVAIPAGDMVPFCMFGGTSGVAGSVLTANFGASAFTGVVPSGFTSGWWATWSSFKLTATLSSPQPGMVGVIEAHIRAAKASTIYYIDPQIVLT